MAQAKRKKKFFDVEIPIVGKTTHLQAYEIGELDGKTMKYDLSRVLRGKNLLLNLKVEVKEEKANSIPMGAKILPYSLRRMVRKGTDYVEDSFDANCKDAKLKIKPLLVTRRRVSRAVRKGLREKAKEEITNYIKDKTKNDLFDELLRNQIQKPLSLKLKKVYPLSLCEIRELIVEEELEEETKENKK